MLEYVMTHRSTSRRQTGFCVCVFFLFFFIVVAPYAEYIYTYPSHVMDTGMHVQTEHIAQTSEVPKSRTHIHITRILGPQVDAEH